MRLKHVALGLTIAIAAASVVTTAQAETESSFHYLPIGPAPSPDRAYPSPMDCTTTSQCSTSVMAALAARSS